MDKKKRLYTLEDLEKLPNFLNFELIDGELYSGDYEELEIDEDVFANPPSKDQHVTYRLSVVKVDKDKAKRTNAYLSMLEQHLEKMRLNGINSTEELMDMKERIKKICFGLDDDSHNISS